MAYVERRNLRYRILQPSVARVLYIVDGITLTAMPVCEGLPDGPCPQRRSDKSVKTGKGDLLLCPSCDTERRRLFDQSKKADEATKQTRSTRNIGMPISSAHIETTVTASVSSNDGRTDSTSISSSPSTAITTTINELLTYAIYYRDKSTVADLHKVIVGFYLPSEITDAKKELLNAYAPELADCQYKTARRHSTTRSAHDAEVEDILCMLELIDNGNGLHRNRFTAVSLDRLPRYGPNEINICAVVDRQLNADKDLAEMKDKFNVFSTNMTSVPTISSDLISDHLKPVTDMIQIQLDQFMLTCNKLNETLKAQANTPSMSNSGQTKSSLIDRSMNVVLTGVAESRNATIWRDVAAQALKHAAGVQIDIIDAFRLSRFTEGKTRPVLVKMNSVWNRRLVFAGARKLRDITTFNRVIITADEPLEVRRRNTLDRLRLRAQRDGKSVSISSDGVLSIDGVDTFSLQGGFISTQSSKTNIPNV